MTPTPGGQPKPQSSQQPGNEPGGANGMYGRFGQTPGQQPSQGFRQKVDGVRRGFGGRQQRGGMRQRGGMGQMQNNNAQGQAPQQDPVGYDGRPVQRQGSGMGPATGNARQADRSQDQGQASSYRTSGQYDRDRAGGMQDGAVSGRETLFNATQQPMQQDQPDYGRFAPGPAADSMESRALAVGKSGNFFQGLRGRMNQPGRDIPADFGKDLQQPTNDGSPVQGQSQSNEQTAYRRNAMQPSAGDSTGFNPQPSMSLGQMQNGLRSFMMSKTPGVVRQGDSLGINGQPVDRSEQGNSVSDRGYGRFAPEPDADAPSGDTSAQERAAANPFGGAGYGSGQYGSAFGNTQQPMNNAAQSTPVAPVRNTQNMGSDQPMPTATTTQAQPSVAPVQNTQNMGGQQSPPVAQTTQATPAPSGFASPFGMMRFGAPPAQPEQPQAEDMQPRETFQTGQSSLRQPLPSLEGQSRRRQRDRFGYGA